MSQSKFANPYSHNVYWVIKQAQNSRDDFYCIATSSKEVFDTFPDAKDCLILDQTEFVLTEGKSPQSLKRLLEEEKCGKIVCDVGEGLHQRKWRWMS